MVRAVCISKCFTCARNSVAAVSVRPCVEACNTINCRRDTPSGHKVLAEQILVSLSPFRGWRRHCDALPIPRCRKDWIG